MIIKSKQEHLFWVDKSNMHGLKVVNNTIDNDVDARLEDGRLLVNSLNNKEFEYEVKQGGFPIRIDEWILS